VYLWRCTDRGSASRLLPLLLLLLLLLLGQALGAAQLCIAALP
jgi:hypothetical protein